MSKFEGTYTVMVTPFQEDMAVDEMRLRQLVDTQIEQGIHGLIPLGSTGEFLSLTDEERHQVAKIVTEKVDGRVPVLIGTTAESTLDAIRYAKDAEALGADGVMILPPFYSNPTEDEIFHHYRTIGDAIGLPIMVYNNPNASNVDMLPTTIARLAEIDNVQYVKESTLEVSRVRDILRLAGDRITVFGGVLGFESYVMGAKGWVAVGSNVMPAEFAGIYNAVVRDKNIDKAQELYRRILPVIDLVFGHRYVSGTKALFDAMGQSVGIPRPPRLPSPQEDIAWANRVVRELGLK
ncbi:4-hydroxy-tetrahydrodipicolinate synthase [Halomonas huangheensis]|uniref:4-hydroxy-tetrahydrodipicolinate synthase n=1 Tax=Halomonas huangheensis TaxID=1178482 RepID=W1N218_9GAMM|nr:4-hydroxy-tetrahydrodipicolinate synthase [Halomonas huangheensis]ALM50968.1 4-hydroxy-tetrahydrodipicolinate synthase [Halomonas huangheensis]ERL49206.1 hypothetical protein BJB45_21450 [Halomonas huangheensis]